MSDACFVGVWHRYVLRRAGTRVPGVTDAGITLVEILVAIILLSIALIGTAGEIAAYIKQQVVEKSQINANHLADSWFEYAESQADSNQNTVAATAPALGATDSDLAAISTASTSTAVVKGVTFQETMTPIICSPANLAKAPFSLANCTGNSNSEPNTIYSTITIKWKLGNTSHQLVQTRDLEDNELINPGDTTSPSANGLSNCTRAQVTNSSGVVTPVSVSTFTVVTNTGITTTTKRTGANTGRAYADGTTGFPTFDPNGAAMSSVTVTLKETGLVDTSQTGQSGFGPATCIPLYWTDTNGTHQVDMHTVASGAGACTFTATTYNTIPCTYTATVLSTAISETGLTATSAAGPWDANIPFCAYVLAPTAPATISCGPTTTTSSIAAVTTFDVNLGPALTCTTVLMDVSSINLALLGKIIDDTWGATNISCTSANLVPAAGDTVKVSALGTVIATLTYNTAPKTWTASIPTETKVTNSCTVLNCPVALTANTTRASDGASQTPTLAMNVTVLAV
jgi:Tfp pilus assembly protein PilV